MNVTKEARETQLAYEVLNAFEHIEALAKDYDLKGVLSAAKEYKAEISTAIRKNKRDEMMRNENKT